MMQGTYTAALGISSQQKRIDTVANNLANVNTNAYKTNRVEFKDALYNTMSRVEQPQEDLNMEKGHGVLVTGITPNFTQGLYQETERDTDCYIEGEGFFRVQSPEGQIYYTRDGNFYRSVQADGTYLVNARGYYVLDTNGQRINIQGTELSITQEGYLSEGDGSDSYARLSIVRFPNQEGLLSTSNNLYAVSDASGAPEAVNTDTKVIQYAVEGSNVNMADEFASLIRATRAMQLASRALSTADEMDGTANTVRR